MHESLTDLQRRVLNIALGNESQNLSKPGALLNSAELWAKPTAEGSITLTACGSPLNVLSGSNASGSGFPDMNAEERFACTHAH